MIKTAEVIEDDSKEDEVGLNNTVTVYFEDDEMEETYRIVTSVRGNSLGGLISIESPMGKALIGKKTGERVEVKVGEGNSYYIVIKAIEKTTDDSKDKLRGY